MLRPRWQRIAGFFFAWPICGFTAVLMGPRPTADAAAIANVGLWPPMVGATAAVILLLALQGLLRPAERCAVGPTGEAEWKPKSKSTHTIAAGGHDVGGHP